VKPALELPRARTRAWTCDAPRAARAERRAPEKRGHAAAPELPRADLLLIVFGDFFLVASYCPTKNSRVLKTPLFFSVLAAVSALMLSPSSWFLLRLV
jgi:hypothetical protein